jgi:hypothetical protein
MTTVILIEKLIDLSRTSFLASFAYTIQQILTCTRIAILRTIALDTGQTLLAGVQRFIYCGRPLTDDDDEEQTAYVFAQLLKTKQNIVHEILDISPVNSIVCSISILFLTCIRWSNAL